MKIYGGDRRIYGGAGRNSLQMAIDTEISNSIAQSLLSHSEIAIYTPYLLMNGFHFFYLIRL